MNYMVFTTRADWRDAPEWANFLSQDRNGALWWYENRPICDDDGVWHLDHGNCEVVNACTASLLERPAKKWWMIKQRGFSKYILLGPQDEKMILDNKERAHELLALLNKEGGRMKTKAENTKLVAIAEGLKSIFRLAGYSCDVEYIESAEAFLIKDGANEYAINCYASSVSACVIDIFTQGEEIVRKLTR